MRGISDLDVGMARSKLHTAYDLLGVREGASDDELKSAYRSLAKRLHPDVYVHDGLEEDHPWLPVSRAYALLTDERRRFVYDQMVLEARVMRLADPERFERWFEGHVNVDYERGIVYRGSDVLHRMGEGERFVIRHRHALGWALTGALVGGFAARTAWGWRPAPAVDDAAATEAREDPARVRRERTAFIGGLLSGTGAATGWALYLPPARSWRGGALVGGSSVLAAAAGHLSLRPLFVAAAGHEPRQADEPLVVSAHANSRRTHQAAGVALGALHGLLGARPLALGYGRVAACAAMGWLSGSLADSLLARLPV